MKGFRFKCVNEKCKHEFHKSMSPEDFDRTQYSADGKGHSCYDCGFPKMVVMRSNKLVKDGFVPGFQRSIRKHCETYSEYKQHLKNMGLVELGYEDIPESKGPETQYFDDEMMRKIYQKHGVSISGREADQLQGLI